MKARVYIDRLFEGYENTPELKDFKEEITANLQERIQELQVQGMLEREALDKAAKELGDVTEIADQISTPKRREAIDNMYSASRAKASQIHALGYTVCLGAILFGMIAAAIVISVSGEAFVGVAVLLISVVPAGAALVFLRLTQETPRKMPMSWKRALIYGLAAGVTLFGLFAAALLYFMHEMQLAPVFGVLLPSVLPGLCLITFMVLTENGRHKPGMAQQAPNTKRSEQKRGH